MDNPLQSAKPTDVSFVPLGNGAAFLLDLEGQKVLAVRLPKKVEKEISGQEPESTGGLLSKLKVKLGFETQVERWLTVANIDNPLLEQSDRFGALVVEGLSNATGTAVPKSSITISASVPINPKEETLAVVQ